MTPDTVICRNIQFDREGKHALVVGDNLTVYFADARVSAGLLALGATELAQYLGAIVVLDGRVVVGFRAIEGQLATGDDDSADFPRPMGATPALPAVKIDRRKILDRYGLAVEVRPATDEWPHDTRLEVIAYPIMRYGAISPVGTVVTRWTPEFLSELNRVLGTAYTLASFGIVEVDDGMDF